MKQWDSTIFQNKYSPLRSEEINHKAKPTTSQAKNSIEARRILVKINEIGLLICFVRL